MKASAPAYSTQTVVSKTKDELLACTGSKYSILSPLYDIKEIIEPGKRSVFVGKPCDISALRMMMDRVNVLNESICYSLSFFCAGGQAT